ncbi:anti-sigma regulatory factor (Ser/Thr protein kinase) [Streptomyces aurantiacus]|uniref:ATP-binding protein n=1 Tax=Streptomyces aurantiacus TaxID=47760 RepID=UPI00278DB90E|nr:ATP-binding protein [Streptomyces aurantiacus]MDQ0776706.1 anti-sigma regulatory factor (Ser/Thr protein kinase) [Streptomyces aurantiacus]
MNQETAQPPSTLDCTIRNFTVLLSPTPRGARLARRLTTEQLRSWELPLDPDRAEHIVAELAANAITHGRVPGRDFRLTLYVIGGTLRIEVTDARGDRPVPRPQHPTLTAESGRGLAIVEALADRWGVTQGPPPRKTVWAEISPATTDTRSFPSR